MGSPSPSPGGQDSPDQLPSLATPDSSKENAKDIQGKRKKIDIKEVFNTDEDDSQATNKKRKLVPIG